MELAIDLLIGRIASVVENEVSLLRGVHHELESIKIELQHMHSFVRDAGQRKQDLSAVEQTWVEIVRDTGHETEDVIDNFTYYTYRQRTWNKLKKAVHFPSSLMKRHQLATELQNIKRRLKEYTGIKTRYDRREVTSPQQNTNSVIRRIIGEAALYHKDDHLVGVEDAKKELLDLLLNGERDLTVISVFGMGGSGKTTLVASVFRSNVVKQHFDDCYAWVTVSQTNYSIESLLRSMIKEFCKVAHKGIDNNELNQMDRRELVEILLNYLQEKRYFLVLDDVWEMDTLWIALNVAVPANEFGSRIILTTRRKDVASFPLEVRSYPYNMKLLPDNKAWELFWKKAFPHSPDKCSPELVQIARQLVRKCGGLPLGLATLGASLSTKELEFDEWKRVHDCLNWELDNNPALTILKDILWLSFYEMPYRLKQCFLYCSIFPEDFEFRKGRLIRLWIAEGFVEQDRGVTQEKMAEFYILELVRRCMLQVFKPDDSSKTKQAFRMHDLIRELAVSISNEERFCTIYNGQEVKKETRLNRLAIQANYTGAYKDMSKVRSCLIFDTIDNVTTLFSRFKQLRVLDLKRSPIVQLPKELMDCYNLRYLNLNRTLIQKLPNLIGKLHNLQMLDIRHTKIRVLPNGIVKLSNLRHLLTYSFNDEDGLLTCFKTIYGTQAPTGIHELKNLQVLSSIEVEKGLVKSLICMTQLTRIGLRNLKEVDGKDLCSLIERMKLIESLALQASNENVVLKIDEVLSVSPVLKSLILNGKLKKVPHWFDSLHCLRTLCLHWSRFTVEFLPQIGELPNLINLHLRNAYGGDQLCFKSGFIKLKFLSLDNFPLLNTIIIEKDVMPTLQELKIAMCKELKRVPLGVEHLSCLEKLYLRDIGKELIERIRKEGGLDRHMVQHIPIIKHRYKVANSDWTYETLS